MLKHMTIFKGVYSDQILGKNKIIKKKTLKLWNRMPRKVVESPLLEVFETQLDKAQSDLT